MSIHQIRFGPYRLNDNPAQLSCGDETITLRPKSLAVLRYLAERPGQIVKKDELFRRVWAGRVVSDSGLRLCIREIRAALEEKAETPLYIETISGQGYRFLEGGDGRGVFPVFNSPMVGRISELRQLEDYFQLVDNGNNKFVVLSGEPGIGKTTLLQRFLNHISNQYNANIIQGQCVVHYGKSEAYGPILDVYDQLKRSFPDLLLVLVPRHPERFSNVYRLCQRAGYQVVRRSEQATILDDTVEIYLGDTMGYLMALYAASDVAFVGGSLVATGGHNLLEPRSLGTPVIYGPHTFNFPEIAQITRQRNAGIQVNNKEALKNATHDLLSRPELRHQMGDAGKLMVEENKDALQQTLALIDPLLKNLPSLDPADP